MSAPARVAQGERLPDDETTPNSITDLRSGITHANDSFVDVSGYSLSEPAGSLA